MVPPVLFLMYLDGLLKRLSQSAIGCYWGHQFAGALCYADDNVLLAPHVHQLYVKCICS